MDDLYDTQELFDAAIALLVKRGKPFKDGWIVPPYDNSLPEYDAEYLLERTQNGPAFDFALEAERIHDICARHRKTFWHNIHKELLALAITYNLNTECLDELI